MSAHQHPLVRFTLYGPIALAVSLLFLGMAALPAAANPVPGPFVWINVHSWDPNYCVQNPITSCTQITQYSTAQGTVEFDLFVDSNDFQYPMTDFWYDTNWPDAWQYVGYESCTGGTVQETPYPDHATVHVTYNPPLQPNGEIRLIGRIRMSVSGFGELKFMNIGYDPLGNAFPSDAMAGVQNCWCAVDCQSLLQECGAALNPTVLPINVLQGQKAEGDIDAWLRSDPNGHVCNETFTIDVPWISLNVLQGINGPTERLVVLKVDASNLAVGDYQAQFIAESTCHDCATVIVHVLENTAAPEPTSRMVNWGVIKHQYR